ncbi:hypothetical protein NX782_06795, partial [Massilia norwichensis]|nr:hypothetical protein [Massilia norwichensis]
MRQRQEVQGLPRQAGVICRIAANRKAPRGGAFF